MSPVRERGFNSSVLHLSPLSVGPDRPRLLDGRRTGWSEGPDSSRDRVGLGRTRTTRKLKTPSFSGTVGWKEREKRKIK